MDRGAWWATVHGVSELDMTGHSSILALKELIICGTNTQPQPAEGKKSPVSRASAPGLGFLPPPPHKSLIEAESAHP